MNKIDLMKKLRDECYSCSQCDLHKNRPSGKSPYVFGSGKVNASIMLVGQNPGMQEALRKRPFIGSAGAKLDKALQEAGINRDDIYITNSVLCYTNGNTLPTDQSVEACRSHLINQIKVVQPEIIVVMGGSAFRSFESKKKFSVKLCEEYDIVSTELHDHVMYTVHPAYSIYHPDGLNILIKSLVEARNFIERRSVNGCNASQSIATT